MLLGDPMEIALVETARALPLGAPGLQEAGRNSLRRRPDAAIDGARDPGGPTLFCKGAPEMVLPLCDRILADGEVRPFDAELRTKFVKRRKPWPRRACG